MPKTKNEPLIGLQEAADYLDVSIDTLRDWSYKNVGPNNYLVGRHLKFRMSELDEWLESRSKAHK